MKTKSFLLSLLLCFLSVNTATAADTLVMKAMLSTTSRPMPHYPEEAERKKIMGGGVYVMKVNPAGLVTAVQITQSTGSSILDNAAISAFTRWRFKPGSVSSVKAPVAFSMPGYYAPSGTRERPNQVLLVIPKPEWAKTKASQSRR